MSKNRKRPKPNSLFLDFDYVINSGGSYPFTIQPHVINMIKTLCKMKVPLYVLSFNIESAIRETLKRYKILNCFRTIYARDSTNWVGNYKPQVLVRHVKLGKRPLFVDDDLENIREARERGIHSVHIRTRSGITKQNKNKILSFFRP